MLKILQKLFIGKKKKTALLLLLLLCFFFFLLDGTAVQFEPSPP